MAIRSSVIVVKIPKGGSSKTTLSAAFCGHYRRAGLRVAALDADLGQGLVAIAHASRSSPLYPMPVYPVRGVADLYNRLTGDTAGKDVVIIDTMGQSDTVAQDVADHAAKAADLVVIPCRTGRHDLAAAIATYHDSLAAGGGETARPRAVVVLTQTKPKCQIAAYARKTLAAEGVTVLTAELPNRAEHIEVSYFGGSPAHCAAFSDERRFDATDRRRYAVAASDIDAILAELQARFSVPYRPLPPR